MTRLNINQWLALLLLAFSMGYLVMAFQIPVFPLPRPVDSDAFPKLLGGLMLLLSLLLYFEKPADKPQDSEKSQESTAEKRKAKLQLTLTAIAIPIYALLIEPLGFVLASLLLGFGLAWLYGYRRHGINLLTISLVVLPLYLLLSKVMGIYLPTGPLPF